MYCDLEWLFCCYGHSKKPILIGIVMNLTRVLCAMSATTTGPSTVFRNVCLGGTFDGIHAGHKVLFDNALGICNQKLVVGVTDSNMIRGKKLWELIAPVEERCQKVREYLNGVNPNITYQIVPISDIYGPTITDQELECIVVSEETKRGADKINLARKEKGWPELKVKVVSLVEEMDPTQKAAMGRLNESKVSSSTKRLEKLGTILKPPKENNSIPKRPYLIGLTGGVASGKTSISKYLESQGYGLINYDLLGHKTYEKVGSPTYNQIIEEFGPEVCNETTKEIIRSKLGKIVFSDKAKLQRLNGIVWPAIYALVDEEIERLKAKHRVIVLESALLIESNQSERVHQIWTVFVSAEEAIRRQVETRGLSREEAEKRVSSQLDNVTRISKSNAVFCSAWEVEFTLQQVRKCVGELEAKYLGEK